MIGREWRAMCRIGALGALLAGCAEDDVVPITVEVGADIAVDPATGITGAIVLDVEAPPGGEPRALVLLSVTVGAFVLAAEHLEGVDDFPDTIAPGESRRVVLRVSRPIQPGELQLPLDGCGEASATWQVTTTVMDAAVAETTHLASGPVTASVDVVPAQETVQAPVTVRPLWSSPEAAVVASAPDDDVMLTVTASGVARHVAVDGTMNEPADLDVAPWVAARGGGVDVVAGAMAVDDPRCGAGTAVDAGVVARFVDGTMAWCHPLGLSFTGVMAVAPDGVAWMVDGSDDGTTRIRRFTPEGAEMPVIAVVPWVDQLAPSPDGRMVAVGTDLVTGSIMLMVLDGAALRTSPLDAWAALLRHRVDGTVAVALTDGWYEVDLDAAALRALASFDPSHDVLGTAVAELDGGDVMTIAPFDVGVVMSLHHQGAVTWRGALTCDVGAPSALATVGPSRVVATTTLDGLPGPDGATTTLFALDRAP